MNSLWFVLGAILGMLNALTQWWTVARLRPERPRQTLRRVIGGAALRWAFAAGLLSIACQRGVIPALLTFAGLWLARWGMIYYIR